MNAAAGYSGTALARKLGLKDGHVAAFVNLPPDLDWLTAERALAVLDRAEHWDALARDDYDFVHLFTDSAATVDAATPALRRRIKPDGMIWVSWPKKASNVPTDVTEDVIRARALRDVLVDVKVCAVDQVWSGLKLVIRKEHRT